MNGSVRPPRRLETILSRLLPAGKDGEAILGDLREEFARLHRRHPVRARLWYLAQVLILGSSYGSARAVETTTLLRTARHTLRGMVRAPGFAVAVTVTIGLSMGLGAAVFSVVDGVLLRSLPFERPDELVRIWAHDQASGDRFLAATYADIESFGSPAAFDGLAGMSIASSVLIDRVGEPIHATEVRVSAGFFDVLGMKALLGRLPSSQDVAAGDAVLAVSEAFWRTRYGADPGVLGQTLELRGRPSTIVGVVPTAISYPRGGDFWRLLTPEEVEDDDREVELIGRLSAGVIPDRASEEVRRIAERLASTHPDTHAGISAWVQPMHAMIVREARVPLLLFLCAAASILLIACVNVSSLFLARASGRGRMTSVRYALGASRARIAAEHVVETLTYAVVGGALGVLVGRVALGLLLAMAPRLPRTEAIELDLRVAAFFAMTTIVVGLVAGLQPALKVLRADLGDGLKEGGRSGRSAGAGLRKGLVVAEVALATMLTATAVLLIHSFRNSLATPWGFEPDGLVLVSIHSVQDIEDGDELRAYIEEIIERVRGIPAVTEVGLASHSLLEPRGFRFPLEVEGFTPPPGVELEATLRVASAGFWRASRVRLLSGRTLGPEDGDSEPLAAVINERLATELQRDGRTVLGTRLRVVSMDFEVVGVVADVQTDVDLAAASMLYAPAERFPALATRLLVRSPGGGPEVVSAVRSAIASVDPSLPLDQMDIVSESIGQLTSGPRFNMIVVGVFAGLALVLAATGVYGVLMFEVMARSREIGIRRALGAGRDGISRLVLGRLVALGGLGGLLGIGGTILSVRVIRSLLLGIEGTRAAEWAPVVLVLGVVAVLATLVPLRRALAIDPIEVLRR